LVCAAAVFPVFWGLYSKRFTGGAAVASSVAGLVAGMLFFPTTAVGYATGWIVDIGWATQLLVSFGSAMGVSLVIGLALTALARTSSSFDFDRLKDEVRLIPE
jgi:Na+/proline symporter